jgi:hypothetical protein
MIAAASPRNVTGIDAAESSKPAVDVTNQSKFFDQAVLK